MISFYFDYVDCELAALALEKYIRHEMKRWHLLDNLIAERSYLQTRLAKSLRKKGNLYSSGLQQVCSEIDGQLFEYDERPSVLYRREIKKMFEDLIARFWKAARADRERRKEALNVQRY